MDKVRSQGSLAERAAFCYNSPVSTRDELLLLLWSMLSNTLGRATKLQLLPPLDAEQLTSSEGLAIIFFIHKVLLNNPLSEKNFISVANLFKTYLGCQTSLSARAFLQLHKLCYMWGTQTLTSWSFRSVWGREVLISLLRDNWSARGQKPQLQKIRKAKLTLLELCWFIPAEHMASED